MKMNFIDISSIKNKKKERKYEQDLFELVRGYGVGNE